MPPATTRNTALGAGIAGALLMYAGDLLLFDAPGATALDLPGAMEAMSGVPRWRLAAGGAVGPFASILYCVGFYGLGRGVTEGHRTLRRMLFLLFATAIVCGGASHSQYPYLALLARGPATELSAALDLLAAAGLCAAVPMALGSLLFLFAVVSGRTIYRRRLAFFSPLPLILAGQMAALLPPPLLGLVGLGWNNLLFVLFFGLAWVLTTDGPVPENGAPTTLADLHPDCSATVLPGGTPSGGGAPAHEAEARKLAALGLVPGCRVVMRHNRGRSAVVVEYRGTFLALSRAVARRVRLAPEVSPAEGARP